ncbi:MAG TPA: D-glycerate dehydrogenase [Rhodocyclaceae bacterium]|nr:D-glycerate dehydrogenase [Rhodocyclaceae bacterium]
MMPAKILVTRAVFPEVLARLAAHFEVDYHDFDEPLAPSALAARLADKAGALTMPTDRVDAELLAACPQLRAVCNGAVGHNNFDLEAMSRAGVMATNTPGVLDDTTADLAWSLLLASARRVVAADQWVRAGRWDGWRLQGWLGQDVHHATLGILGMGRIGQAVARRAAGFSMRVIYHNRHRLPEANERECNATWVDKTTLLSDADFLVLVLPYTPGSHHIIGAAELALMKPGAHLINIARGGIVDDDALIGALAARRIGGAGLDVFEGEPTLDPRFFALDNVVLTPHIGSASAATRMKMAMLAADNLIAALTGGHPPNLLNPEVRAC